MHSLQYLDDGEIAGAARRALAADDVAERRHGQPHAAQFHYRRTSAHAFERADAVHGGHEVEAFGGTGNRSRPW